MIDYFLSDPHFDHRNIIKYCGRFGMSEDELAKYKARIDFKVSDGTIHRNNEKIISDINATVKEDDRLWILGDFCYPDRDIRKRTE